MKWDNGVEFTADDVVFTAGVHKRFQIPRYYDYWKFIERIEALDKRTVRIVLERPMAIFYTRTLTSWIVQKQTWNPIIGEGNAILGEKRDKAKAQGMKIKRRGKPE
jgi:ABC-type transport system substrate-binding protein